MSAGPWVAVLEAETAVLAVEYNGFQGTDGAVNAQDLDQIQAADIAFRIASQS
jgi:hypothetical protein